MPATTQDGEKKIAEEFTINLSVADLAEKRYIIHPYLRLHFYKYIFQYIFFTLWNICLYLNQTFILKKREKKAWNFMFLLQKKMLQYMT